MSDENKKIQSYISRLPIEQQIELNRLCDITRNLVPEAEETISYGMPAFKYKNKPLIYFGGFKDHISVFPTSGPIDELKDQLIHFKKAKGTISYKLDDVIPEEIIKKLLTVRIAAIDNK